MEYVYFVSWINRTSKGTMCGNSNVEVSFKISDFDELNQIADQIKERMELDERPIIMFYSLMREVKKSELVH